MISNCWFFSKLIALIILIINFTGAIALSEQGKYDFDLDAANEEMLFFKTMFRGSEIYVSLICHSPDIDSKIQVSYDLTQLVCTDSSENQTDVKHEVISPLKEYPCSENGGTVILEKVVYQDKNDKLPSEDKPKDIGKNKNGPLIVATQDGFYKFHLLVRSQATSYNVSVHAEVRQSYGYLSAADYPSLHFYGIMCVVYVILGIIWLAVSFSQWRDLLRIQFWIGGVILLGMLEKAMFYAEYHSINTEGYSTKGLALAAEWVSCCKRTLARMLVIIVSLGFGIVKPRLGPMLHRVVGTGLLYLVLACVEGYIRTVQPKYFPHNQLLVAAVPLAVLDSAICWWIFTSLVQTTRTLRVRRNLIKLALYRHFTNTLIFAVIASVIFMLYSIKERNLACSNNWKQSWIDDAFWHILFSVLLVVIVVLWRPTNNNQRYAFSPLLDNPEDEDDEEEEQFVSDAYGVKMRSGRSGSPKLTNNKNTTNEEDDLRWVEENIPTAIADATLPILDSDEEILNTKFEVSKMQ